MSSIPKTFQIIDLTQKLSPNSDELIPVKIEYVNHKKGGNLLGLGIAWQVWSKKNILQKLIFFIWYFFTFRLIKSKHFPGKQGLSMEKVFAMSHCGTHIDAPNHYDSSLPTIDMAPLNLFYDRPGVLLDFSHLNHSELITIDLMKSACLNLPHNINAGDIVLIKTNASHNWGIAKYYTDFPALTPEAVSFLLDHGVEVIGVDMFAVDMPQHLIAQKYEKSKDSAALWPVHLLGRTRPYYIIENLTNLASIPMSQGFRVTALPIKLEKAGASWARVVAII